MADERENGEYIHAKAKGEKGDYRCGGLSETPKAEERENELAIIARGG